MQGQCGGRAGIARRAEARRHPALASAGGPRILSSGLASRATVRGVAAGGGEEVGMLRTEGSAGRSRDAAVAAGSSFARWARTEHSEGTRTVTLALVGAPLFLCLIPLLVVGIGPRLDGRLGLPRLPSGIPIRVAGGVLALTGFGLGLWSVAEQVTRGRGTPLPVMPTQQLLTQPPFCYCRNPMTLGTILAYLGLALARATFAGAALVAALSAGLVVYLKGIEERELAERFGEAYLAYKRDTPFLIPRLAAHSA